MAGEWKTHRVGDIAAAMGDAPFGSLIKNHDYTDSGALVVQGKNIQGRTCDWTDRRYVSHEKYQSLRRSHCMVGDLLFPKVGTIGKVGILTACPSVDEYVLSTNTMRFRADPKVATADYVYYFFTWSETVNLIHALNSNSVQPVFNFTSLKNFQIPLPPLAEQKAIAAVLGALDDKIELNRRMNATLEAMARALFQSWFVDFDPVHAKLDGRPPAPASLFPASFQDSEAGHIPTGWTLGKVSDCATLNRGAVNPGDFPTETFDHFSLPAFDNGRTPKVELGSAIMSNKFTVTPNSVLISKLNPHIPRIWLPDLHTSRRSVCSTEFMVACSKPSVTREYLFSLFTSSAFASIYGTLVTGTTGSHQRIRPESVLDMKIVIPSAALIQAFTDIAKPMFDRINRNTEQSRTLATLRDTLLPKLLSGELSVAGGNSPELPESSNQRRQKQ
jgi:type I restriction enzyme S subunit